MIGVVPNVFEDEFVDCHNVPPLAFPFSTETIVPPILPIVSESLSRVRRMLVPIFVIIYTPFATYVGVEEDV